MSDATITRNEILSGASGDQHQDWIDLPLEKEHRKERMVGVNTVADEPLQRLPADVANYHIYLGKLLQDASELCTVIELERRSLLYFARKYDITRLEWATEDSDPTDAVHDVQTYCLPGSDIPFFSDGVLYELLGKEDARTILAIVDRLIKRCVAAG